MNEQDQDYDAFAAARLMDSFKVLEQRQQFFQVVAHEHVATQDLCGGDLVETITIRWRPTPPKPETNGHGPLT